MTQAPDTDIVVWRDDNLAIVELGAAPDVTRVKATVRSAGIDRIDVLIARRSSSAAAVVRDLQTDHEIAAVWAPATTMGLGEAVPPPGTSYEVDGLTLNLHVDGDELTTSADIA